MIERNYSGAFNVWIEREGYREAVDTVFFSCATVDEVRRSLIEHDGYDSAIVVTADEAIVRPFSDTEVERISADYDLTIALGPDGGYTCSDESEDKASDEFATKSEALETALYNLGVEIH